MSQTAVIGCGFVAASLLFMTISFGSPYWVESFEEFKSRFVKCGLWEFCFNDYTFYKDYKGKRFLGCFYVFSNTVRPIWEWLSPPWFIGVQVMISSSLLLIFITSVFCVLYVFKLFRKNIEGLVLVALAAVQFLAVLLTFISLIVFGVYAEDRDWMPRPDMNLLSWSYGLAVISMFCSLMAGIIFMLDGMRRHKEMADYRPPVTTYT